MEERRAFVELIDRLGHVRSRQPIRSFPFSIGRGYENDLILEDRRVSKQHARIERDEEGRLTLVDCGSTNGVVDERTGKKVATVPIAAESRVRLGAATLRFAFADTAREDTLRLSMRPRFLQKHYLWPMIWTSLFGGVVALRYLVSRSFDLSDELSDSLVGVLLLLLWTSAWAVATRINSRRQVRRFQFAEHALVAGAAALAIALLGRIGRLVAFAMSVSWPMVAGEALIALSICWMFYRHLRYLGKGPRWLGAVLAVAIGVTAFWLDHEGETETVSAKIRLAHPIFPPDYDLVGGRPLEDFFESTTSLRREIDRLADEE